MRIRPTLIKCISIILVTLFVSGLVIFFLPTPSLYQGVYFSKALYSNQKELLRLTLSKDDKYRLFTPLSQIAKPLQEATLLQEDTYFRQHIGVNPVSLVKAIWQTYWLHSRRIGASTITMQLARIRFGIQSRHISGKLLQMLRAIQLEMHYSKDQILEAYLNLAPYGGNIEGIGAASLIYFNHPAAKLTLAEALTLSIIPQNPVKRTAQNTQLQTIRSHLLNRWLEVHPEDKNKQALFDLPLVMQTSHTLPFKAPHFVDTLLKLNSTLRNQNIYSSLDSRAQKIIERVSHQYIERHKAVGVYNTAVLMVDSRDMGVKALMGSNDFFNKTIGGQINGVETKRSPGSTLKPFIYALALDQGLIHPNTVLKDVSQSFNGYNPENFDYDFMGPIKAKDALVLSRNIPAIELSSQLTQTSLHQLLEKAKISQLKPESYYGLSLNLGGAELTLRELVGLYAMLLNDGLWYPLHFLQSEKKYNGLRIVSPEASYLVLDMLKNTQALGTQTSSLPLSWKTGTSSGYRDAWTIGTFGPYVLGVWIGNFDNKSNPAFVGKDIALPLFIELTQALQQEMGPIEELQKDVSHMNLKQIEVCKSSGGLPTPYCPETELTWFIPGKSPIKTDTIYREVAINNKTGLRTCHIDDNTHFEVFEFWPSDLLKIFKKAGIQRHTPPFYESDCSLSGNNNIKPQMTSPQTGISYVIQVDSKKNNKIPFSAVTEAGVQYLYWFLNGTFLAKVKSDTVYLWKAKPGRFIVRVVDDHGVADSREIRVRLEG